MSWIRRETEKGTVQYICPRCHDYHEFREDFGERTFSENYIFCRRCGARNGTGNAPTLTPPNEWISVKNKKPELGERVLATDGAFVGEGYMDCYGVWCRPNGMRWNMLESEVTHWMPLPSLLDRRPPEGEEGDANRG